MHPHQSYKKPVNSWAHTYFTWPKDVKYTLWKGWERHLCSLKYQKEKLGVGPYKLRDKKKQRLKKIFYISAHTYPHKYSDAPNTQTQISICLWIKITM